LGLFCVSLVRCHRSARLRTPSIIVRGGRVADRHFALPPVLSLPTPVLSLQLALRPHPQFPTPTFLRLKSPTFLRLSPDRCRCCARLSGRASNRGKLRRGAGSLGGVGFGRRPSQFGRIGFAQRFCAASPERYRCLSCKARASMPAEPCQSMPNHNGQITIPATPAATFLSDLPAMFTRKVLDLLIVRGDFRLNLITGHQAVGRIDRGDRIRCTPRAANHA
jgi:hypothetical protein